MMTGHTRHPAQSSWGTKGDDGWIVKVSDVAPPDNERTPDTYGPNKIAFDVAFKASVKK